MAKNIKQQNLPACYVTWVLERKRRQTVMEIRFPGAASVPYDELAGNGYRIGLYREFSGGLRPVLFSAVVYGDTFPLPFLHLSLEYRLQENSLNLVRLLLSIRLRLKSQNAFEGLYSAGPILPSPSSL